MSDDRGAHSVRSTEEVFLSHLEFRCRGQVEEDILANFAPDVVLLIVNSNATGHHAIRHSAARLAEQLPESEFKFLATQVNGDFALLIWCGTSSKGGAIDGADSL